MNAMIHSFDEIETVPLPWAMPIPIDYGSAGARQIDDGEVTNAVRSALDKILTLPALPTKTETVVSSTAALQRWTENVSLAGWIAAHECFGRSLVFDTKARASVQTMYTVATVKAWMEKQRVSQGTQSTAISTWADRTFVPHYVDFCDQATAGSFALLTTVRAVSGREFEISDALGSLIVSETGALAGYDRYTVPNWDGDQAQAILQETITATRQFLQILPSNFGEPDIAPGADGTIGLEWIPDTGPLRKLFIDVGPKTVWRGYWKFANGEFGEAHGLTSDSDISETMKTLFRHLSK